MTNAMQVGGCCQAVAQAVVGYLSLLCDVHTRYAGSRQPWHCSILGAPSCTCCAFPALPVANLALTGFGGHFPSGCGRYWHG